VQPIDVQPGDHAMQSHQYLWTGVVQAAEVSGPAKATRGLLFPESFALVAATAEGWLCYQATTGLRAMLSGRFAEVVAGAVAARAPTLELSGWQGAHPIFEHLAAWLATPALPLDAAGSVRLDGFDTLFLELTGRCNERCQHCYASSSPEVVDALEPELVDAIIDDAAVLGFRRVQLTGGDPLLSRHLPHAAARVRARGMLPEIYTNGLALSDELLAELLPAQPSFAFSLYSHRAEVHDEVTRTPGSHRRTLEAVKRVQVAGLELRVAMVVMEHNAADAEETLAFLRREGIERASAGPSFAVGRGDHYDSAVPSGGRGVEHRDRSGEERGREGKLCVTYRGEVVPCIFNRDDVIGDVRQSRLFELVAGPKMRPSRPGAPPVEKRLQCASCKLTATALRACGGPS
jgi:MoaA/NifB/PqqE/SkfB family radical SAM enzyme